MTVTMYKLVAKVTHIAITTVSRRVLLLSSVIVASTWVY